MTKGGVAIHRNPAFAFATGASDPALPVGPPRVELHIVDVDDRVPCEAPIIIAHEISVSEIVMGARLIVERIVENLDDQPSVLPQVKFAVALPWVCKLHVIPDLNPAPTICVARDQSATVADSAGPTRTADEV